MTFNSLEFAIFLPIVFLLYWFVFNRSLRGQNMLVVAASFFFYGWWDWRFLGLLILSAGIDFFVGIQLDKTEGESKRKWLLGLSLLGNLGILGFFKYFNFFADSFAEAFTFFGSHVEVKKLSIVLPLGISFYTFQALSYTIDVYRRKLKSVNDVVIYYAFIAFFPQLVAGPIERATNLISQFFVPRTINYDNVREGLRQMLWGFFKKVVIADSCSMIVNGVFGDYTHYSFWMLALATGMFFIQVYGDFSGYSDIAIGTARLFGFRLMRNFDNPLFSRDLSELWRRWHISLTTWFRDYLFFPLGGSRGSIAMTCRNVMIIFIVSGFWHGANWTYIVWGALNGLFLLPSVITRNTKNNVGQVAEGRMFPSLRELGGMIMTFSLYSFSLIFFRSKDMTSAFDYMHHMLNFQVILFSDAERVKELWHLLILLTAFFAFEWFNRTKEYPFQHSRLPVALRWGYYLLLCVMIIANTANSNTFVYFQF